MSYINSPNFLGRAFMQQSRHDACMLFPNNWFTKEYPNEERKHNTELEVVDPLHDIDETWIMVDNPTHPVVREMVGKQRVQFHFVLKESENENENAESKQIEDEDEETKQTMKRQKRKKYTKRKKVLRRRYNARKRNKK